MYQILIDRFATTKPKHCEKLPLPRLSGMLQSHPLARSCCWRGLRNEYCGGSIPGIMDKVSYLEVDGQHSAQKMVR